AARDGHALRADSDVPRLFRLAGDDARESSPPVPGPTFASGAAMNNRKFSLAHLTVLDAPPPELIHLAAHAGYDYVGLRLMGLGLPGEPRYALHEDRVLLRDTKAALDATGVRVLDVELARIMDEPGPETYLPVF